MLTITIYIVFLGFLKLLISSKMNSRKLFVFIAGFVLFLIAALRSINVKSDVVGYVDRYISLSSINLSELWINFISGTGKDTFFYMFAKIINLFGANYQVWLAILGGIFCFSVSKVIYKYSDEAYISFITLISLGFFYFSLTGLRQALALSMVLLSYKYLVNKKLIPFLAIVVLAALFHSSAIIFVIAYPLANMKVGWKHVTGIIGALVLVYFFRAQVINFLGYLNMDDRYTYYIKNRTILTISGFIIQLCIYLFCLYYKKGVLKANEKNLCLYNLLFLGLVFQAFTPVVAEFFRISMYFSIFSIVLIPESIKAERDKKIRMIIYLVVLMLLIVYIYWTGSFFDYRFYWQ